MSSLTARDILRTALDMEVESSDVLAENATSREERIGWAEHGNRLHVFRLFQYADHVVGDVVETELEHVLDAASQLDAFERVWVIEGVGYRMRRQPSDYASLPSPALVPLHAGAGLAIAARWLQRVPTLEIPAVVAAVADESLRASRPGFERVTFEAMGLAARTLSPQLIPPLDAAVATRSAADRGCFWHGFGRGSYFAISNWDAVDVSAARVVDSIRRLAPDGPAQLSAIAGFIWAVTMVNLRAPDVLEAYIPALLALACDARVIANGVESALIIWESAAPDDDGIDRVLAHTPGAHASRHDWNLVARDPARSARARCRTLVAEGRLQDLFHGAGV